MQEFPCHAIERTGYFLAGLHIVSELPLPVPTCRPDTSTGNQIVIRYCRLPNSLSPIAAEFPEGQCNGHELLLNIPEVARYLIRGGTEILVDPLPAASPGDVSAFLLGTAFGVLVHQRGTPPLHASAIDFGDGCVAFVGASGAGKSTLVAALAARNHDVIADDVCILQSSEQEGVNVWPGLNRLRLWEDAVKALRCDGPDVKREFRAYNKYVVPVRLPQNPNKPRRLRRIYQLDTAADGERASLTQLQGATTIEVLMQNIYRLGLAEHLGRKRDAFLVCAATAQDVPVFRFSRPFQFAALPEAIDVLEAHLLSDIR